MGFHVEYLTDVGGVPWKFHEVLHMKSHGVSMENFARKIIHGIT